MGVKSESQWLCRTLIQLHSNISAWFDLTGVPVVLHFVRRDSHSCFCCYHHLHNLTGTKLTRFSIDISTVSPVTRNTHRWFGCRSCPRSTRHSPASKLGNFFMVNPRQLLYIQAKRDLRHLLSPFQKALANQAVRRVETKHFPYRRDGVPKGEGFGNGQGILVVYSAGRICTDESHPLP